MDASLVGKGFLRQAFLFPPGSDCSANGPLDFHGGLASHRVDHYATEDTSTDDRLQSSRSGVGLCTRSVPLFRIGHTRMSTQVTGQHATPITGKWAVVAWSYVAAFMV